MENYDDERNSTRTIYRLLRRKRLVCRTETCREKFDGGQAIWKTENLDNSIWEIVHHLNFYNEAYLKRFKGIDYVYPTSENSETFSSADAATEDAWRAEVEIFDSIMTEWRSLLEAADENKFNEAVSVTNKSLWSSLLAHVNVHNVYHGGQIVLLRKLQGSWDTKQSVS